jgi:hypothetical protein
MKLSAKENVFRIVTEFTKEALMALLAIDSKAAILKDKDGNDVFAIAWGGPSKITDNCITFGAVDAEGHLVCSILMEDVPSEKFKGKVKKQFYKAIVRYYNLEHYILNAIETVANNTAQLFADLDTEDEDTPEQLTFDDVVPTDGPAE